jgi:acetyl-CoA carboxylase carboxyltransferase component
MSTVAVAPQPSTRPAPLERLELLCDPGSLHVIRSAVASWRMGDRAVDGDGVIGAAGRVGGRPVFCFAQDASYAGGSLGEMHADTIVRVLRLAAKAGAPVVGFVESAGARMQEGTAALAGYGRIFHEHVALSGRVPQISIVLGTSAGGGSYAPALTDFTIMGRDAAMFLTGPAVVRDVMGEDIDAAGLGGPRVHERNGVCHLVVEDAAEAALAARELLGLLPSNADAPAPRRPVAEPSGIAPSSLVPRESRKVYDVRDVVRAVVDGSELLELSPRWARNMVTGFARLEGQSVGVIANQPRYLGGVIDADAAVKAARFVEKCDAFGVPLLVFVDTPGFLPGRRQEEIGVIKAGASLLHAFARAAVPRITVILRKAYGGAYITMNSRDLGAHLNFVWDGAEIGVMGAVSAVGILNRRELAAADDPDDLRARLAADYSDAHLAASTAARQGFVDEVIHPDETRARLRWGLDALSSTRHEEMA